MWSVLAIAVLGAASCKLRPPAPSSLSTGPDASASGGSNGGASKQSSSSGGSSTSGGGMSSPGGQTSNAGQTSSAGQAGSGALSSGGTVATGGAYVAGGTRASGGTSSGSGTAGNGGAGASGGAAAPVEGRDAAVPDLAVDTAPPPPTRGPTPSQPGVKFPFPQNRENSRCIYPNLYRNEDVQAAYTQWKNDTVTSDGADGFRRVKRPNEPGTLEPNSTVSEGIGYGMLMAVYMNDQSLFDDLWQYEQKHLGQYGLMDWNISADGSGPTSGGTGPATDADEDMTFALAMADKQWVTSATLNKKYLDIAKGMMTAVWNNEIYDYKYLKPWPTADSSTINLSYFAPAYYKLFAKIDTANTTNWTNTVDTMYQVLNASLNSTNGNANNGLVPAWCDSSGKPNGGAFGPGQTAPTNYQYDSCRTPFRIGLDWCWNGETRAQAYVAKTSQFFSGITVAKMVDGYDLNGNPHAQWQTGASAQIQSCAFIGPAGVGAMSSSSYQSFVNDAYGVLITGKALVGGTYYDDSWMVMSLLMMTANFLDYTTYP